MRELDGKVIEFMHDQIIQQVADDIKVKGHSEYKIFDSAIGVFTEGGPAFTVQVLLKKHIFKFAFGISIV